MPKALPPKSIDVQKALQHAVVLHQQGRLDDAERLYNGILQGKPGNFDALHLLGVLMHQRGRTAEALKLIAKALETGAKSADALANHGRVLVTLGRHEEAAASFDKALALKPDHLAALIYGGAVLQTLQRPGDALANFDKALAIRPDDTDTVIRRANILFAVGRFTEALAGYDRALALRPKDSELMSNRANTLLELGRSGEAVIGFEDAVALKPNDPDILNNCGNALLALNCPAEALARYDAALAAKPDNPQTLVNRGNALADLRLWREAVASHDRAIVVEPDHAEAHWNKSLLLLGQGDFANGWREYEWRLQRTKDQRNFPQPQWRGEEGIEGKTLLLHAEQGFGDTIQFVRYAPMVAARGAKVVLEVQSSLKALMPSLGGVSTIAARGEPLPAFDLHCPLMSLPLAFSTSLATVPADVPYLHPPLDHVETWRMRRSNAKVPRIGLAWSGSPTHKNDRNRSIALQRLSPLLSLPVIQFVSLQRDVRDADAAVLHAHPHVATLELADFADTAAVISLLDLVIAVDTGVAHLAGALGKPVWILLPFNGEWRWLSDRGDCPWYPTARLFRQPKADDWESVVACVRDELNTFQNP